MARVAALQGLKLKALWPVVGKVEGGAGELESLISASVPALPPLDLT
jgi:hypothetical protein